MSPTRIRWISSVALALVAASLFLPWLRVRLASDWQDASGFGLGLLTVVVVVLVVVAVGAVVVLAQRPSEAVEFVAVTSLAALAALPALAVVLARLATSLAPTGLLPRSLQRLLVDVRPDVGLVLCVGAATTALLAVLHERSVIDLRAVVAAAADRSVGIRTASAVALLTVAGTYRLRYEPWLVLDGGDGAVLVEGWAVPWLGLLSLVLLGVAVLGLAVAVTGARLAGAALLTTAGWSLLAVTAAVLAGGLVLVELTVSAGGWVQSGLSRIPTAVLEFDGSQLGLPLGIEPLGDRVTGLVPDARLTAAPWGTLGLTALLAVSGLGTARRRGAQATVAEVGA